MIVEMGHYALVLALSVTLLQAVVPMWGATRRDAALISVAVPLAVIQFALILASFSALTYAHVVSDFSLINVVENSHSTKPLIYKISGVWGNHEGSMMLWVLILAVFGALVAAFSGTMRAVLGALVLAVQALISSAFLLFILLTSNPFARAALPPIEGQDLNPILQDPGLAIHPPLLYLGYVGFSIAFSFAAAALIDGRIDAAWARFVRPWVLIAWTFLTLGIAMGSYWAYYTLGWGGIWFWDPVENASLMPWLSGTALVHSVVVMEKREALKIWTIFLAILTFSLSLLGTFLVRSGVLTSVHAFANDPLRGVFILLILVLFIGGALALFAWRAPLLKQGGLFAPISREGAIVLNNLFLTVACATVFVGTLYPLALESLTGEKISVGAPYFNLTFGPIMLPLLVILPFGQSLAWKRGQLLPVAQRLIFAAFAGLAGFAVLFGWFRGGPILAPLGTGLAIFMVISVVSELGGKIVARRSLRASIGRAIGLPRAVWGMAFAHAGLGLTLFGLAATGWGVERVATLRPGASEAIGPYVVTFETLLERPGPNYRELAARMLVRQQGVLVGVVEPSRRAFSVRQMTTSEAGIETLGLGQLYFSLADTNPDGSVDVRLYWKPFVILIWIGAMVMAAGGTLSLSDRQLRMGLAAAFKDRVRAPPVQPMAAE
jgi:cytochrome c-type biogenesis protein CcmF